MTQWVRVGRGQCQSCFGVGSLFLPPDDLDLDADEGICAECVRDHGDETPEDP